MKNHIMIAASLAVCGAILLSTSFVPPAVAQETSTPAYLNTEFPPEVRAKDLVGRMTLDEKASQLVNDARAIPRLNVPAYNWWSEALHGVINSGVTEFPEPIGLAATFDVPGIHEMATDIGIEGRIKHVQDVRAGHTGIMGGLDFWAPNLNIFRDPRWGRGQETYGEDPFLTGRMGVAFVTGMQGDDPKYYLAIATPKHFDVHSGPEPTRHFADVDVSKHDMVDTYLPAFRAAVVQGHAGSIMCAYNAINGEPACANQFTLIDQLRDKWGFQGYVVSDCDAVQDIFTGHRYRPTQAQASAISLMRGMDNECYGANATYPKDNSDYKPYIEAVQQGYLPESAVDTALTRLFTARIRLGMFDPPDMVPYTKIPETELNSPAHRALALRLADKSMVLLKNDGTLPLKPGIRRIAVVGPLADQTQVLLGNYAGTPTHTVSLLDGLKTEFPNAKITFVPGIQFLRRDLGELVPASLLTTPDGKPGLEAQYEVGGSPEMFGGVRPKPAVTRVESALDLTADNLPSELKGKKGFFAEWTGFLNPSETGDYLLGFRSNGFTQIKVNGEDLTSQYGGNGTESKLGRIHFEAGEKVSVQVAYGTRTGENPTVQLLWTKVNDTVSSKAVEAARDSDVVIAAVGLTSQLEGEEMPVHEPGFLGGDRTSIQLPEQEQNLLHAVAATGKPLVVVLMNGSALAVNWANQHANAILEAWYSGEEGGNAIAGTLSGKNNPGGRLPVTFYKNVNQLPNFEDYSMKGRTYRYFSGKPLYPFGYGLSYTNFSYSNLVVSQKRIAAGNPLTASARLTNTGHAAGDEVVQLYLQFPDVAGAPRIALRGFQRVHLEPGASETVTFQLNKRDLSMVTKDGNPIVAQGDYALSIGGGQPNTGTPSVTGHFHVNGQITLSQ
ncbi:glycoside hydrolase family 3 C-terminal domain-containing protein [Edaphobacter sp.]|uniref:glycoside hydrolase family 3 C-terminal domain-containing protein n=1 Tax=Edaphobacter sp. TaxID=1934404 RepID=UPI002DB9613C|nr:glycoside hydrolase family 3 C-terminal domain-containing protein [Edaphobacter sp.]HEU5340657.1 glycoside hydrolase family 3 C-terminal domain-containing protein [Edaphobacter sp.]